MKNVNLFRALNDGMGAPETPETLLRHAARNRTGKNPATRPDRQETLVALFSVQEAF